MQIKQSPLNLCESIASKKVRNRMLRFCLALVGFGHVMIMLIMLIMMLLILIIKLSTTAM